MSIEGTIFDVYPRQDELMVFSPPRDAAERNSLEAFRSELIAQHRHADTLLNNRLQGFVVGTSLLIGGYSQFRDPAYALVALLLAVCGLALAGAILHVLQRTARAIEWYIATIKATELVLYESDRRPYSSRHQWQAASPLPVSAILGVGLPLGAMLMWMVLSFIAARLLVLT